MRFRDFVFFVVTTLRDDGWSPPTPQRIASRCSGDFVSPTVQVQDLYIASRNSAAHELFPLQNARKRDKKISGAQLFASGSKSFFLHSAAARSQPPYKCSDQINHRIACGNQPLSFTVLVFVVHWGVYYVWCYSVNAWGRNVLQGERTGDGGPSKRSAEEWFVSRYAKKCSKRSPKERRSHALEAQA